MRARVVNKVLSLTQVVCNKIDPFSQVSTLALAILFNYSIALASLQNNSFSFCLVLAILFNYSLSHCHSFNQSPK